MSTIARTTVQTETFRQQRGLFEWKAFRNSNSLPSGSCGLTTTLTISSWLFAGSRLSGAIVAELSLSLYLLCPWNERSKCVTVEGNVFFQSFQTCTYSATVMFFMPSNFPVKKWPNFPSQRYFCHLVSGQTAWFVPKMGFRLEESTIDISLIYSLAFFLDLCIEDLKDFLLRVFLGTVSLLHWRNLEGLQNLEKSLWRDEEFLFHIFQRIFFTSIFKKILPDQFNGWNMKTERTTMYVPTQTCHVKYLEF